MTEAKPHFRRTADGATFRMADGYRNMVANLGTDRDKAAWGTYGTRVFSPLELLNAYRSAWLPRKIVDIPALDATRKWRSWQAGKDQITAIEAEEKRLNLRERVRDAMTAARLYGGAALYIGVTTGAPDEVLTAGQIGKTGIKHLTVLTPQQISPGAIDRDIASPYFGQPGHYTVNSGDQVQVRIHPSRLVLFRGATVPDAWMHGLGWGDSVLQSAIDAIQQADSTAANIASLVFEAKIDVIHIPRLMELVGDDIGESTVVQRLMLGARAKGINGTLVLDGGGLGADGKVRDKEEFSQKTVSFGTMPELLMAFFQQVSGAADIPMTRLFGRSAGGMNATGDGDERSYFDRVQAMQELEMQPAMAVLDECLIRSALGTRPSEIYYRWNPLRQISESERAEIFSKTATAARALVGTGGTSPALLAIEALSAALVNELTEQGVLPGLEAKVDEFASVGESEDDDGAEEAIEAAGQHPDAALIGDGADSPDLSRVEPYQGRIVLGPERFAEVKEDWAARLVEE